MRFRWFANILTTCRSTVPRDNIRIRFLQKETAFVKTLFVVVIALLSFVANAAPVDALRAALSGESAFAGAASVIDVSEDNGIVYATISIPYLDIAGKEKLGQARVYAPASTLETDPARLPIFAHVHYEKDLGGARHWCDLGWMVVSPHYGEPSKGGIPLELAPGNSYNQAKSILQWVRRLPIADTGRLHIDGGSAGGYMALAMSAELFPVTACTSDAPVMNWSYNANYLIANKGPAKFPIKNIMETPLPVLAMIMGLADQATGVFGTDLTAPIWNEISPISYLDRISCPIMVLCATGDMLVPMEQMVSTPLPQWDPAVFPEGYQRDFTSLTLCDPARKRFDEVVPTERVEVFTIAKPEGLHEYTLANFLKQEKEPASPAEIERPWSKEKQWSLVVLEEGPPIPHSAHTRYKWNVSPDAFIAAQRVAAPSTELLTKPKLARLFERYKGHLTTDGALPNGAPVNRLNVLALEKLDVVSGLLQYAEYSDAHAKRMSEMYYDSDDKPFGDQLTRDQLRIEQAALKKSLGLK